MAKNIIHQHGTGLTVDKMASSITNGEIAIKTDVNNESIISKNNNNEPIEFIPSKRFKTINGESIIVTGDDKNIEVTAGDSGVSVLDSTGTSSTNAISQKAATDAINSIPKGTVTSVNVGDGLNGGGSGSTITISHRQPSTAITGSSEFNPNPKENISSFGSSGVVISNILKDNLGHIISGKTSTIKIPTTNEIKGVVLPSGGSKGQFLSKGGDDDYNVLWGDYEYKGTINEVIAGNGLNGGGGISTGSTGITLNIGEGSGITVSNDYISISSEFQDKIDSGVTSFGWGDHSKAGYIKNSYSGTTEELHYLPSTVEKTISINNGNYITGITVDSKNHIIGASGTTTAHTHAISSVTDLQEELNNKSPLNHVHNASAITAGILSIDRIPTGSSKTTVARGDHGHSNYAYSSHTHAITDVATLQETLNGKSDVDHTHNLSNITDLQTALNAKSDVGHTHSEYAKATSLNKYLPLSGGTLTGDLTAPAFYETSDETLKDFQSNIEVNLEQISNIPKKYFTWKDDNNKQLNIGTSAQEIQKIYPEIVSENWAGKLSVDYAKLSVVALAAIDKLNERIKELEEKLNDLQQICKNFC